MWVITVYMSYEQNASNCYCAHLLLLVNKTVDLYKWNIYNLKAGPLCPFILPNDTYRYSVCIKKMEGIGEK